MKRSGLQRWIRIQHGLLIVLVAWLIATSPWVFLYNRVPPSPSFWVWSHLVLGIVTLALALSFGVTCLAQGRFRHYFPWALGRFKPLLGDLAGLLRLRMPANEGGGLFGVLKGLLLLSLLAVAITGALWWWTAGTRDALSWRGWHLDTVKLMVVFLVLHIVATVSHIVHFMRQ
ncbi:MAG: cytochrome b/b6 domain-containing protein [Wenzhouxiangella sp.]